MFRINTRLGLAAIAATAAVSLVPAAAQAKPKCKPSGSHTVTQNGFARVYTKGNAAFVCIKSNGRKTQLAGADPSDQFALAGKYVGWTGSTDPNSADPGTILLPHSVVTVMYIPNRHIDDHHFPFETNEKVGRIVVANDGAAAWSMTPTDGLSYSEVQGTDRQSHPADQFSDDHADVNVDSLRIHGKTVTWSYVDGKTGSQNLY
jgi:hypothetical protein